MDERQPEPLGEAMGWVYTATPRGGERWNVSRVKGKRRVFLDVALSLSQAQRLADYDKKDRK